MVLLQNNGQTGTTGNELPVRGIDIFTVGEMVFAVMLQLVPEEPPSSLS
jgi:hypothetical protein